MSIEEMSLEELIKKWKNGYFLGGDNKLAEDQILSRFSDLTAKVQELEKKNWALENQVVQDNAMMKVVDDFIADGIMPDDFMLSFSFVDNVVRKVADLQKQVADLKCCGNCRCYDGDDCELRNFNTSSCKCCLNWQSDALTREQRGK
jgi:hypothetical protein